MCWASPSCRTIPGLPTWSSASATAQLTDKTVGDSFATLTRDELLKRLSDADIAFAEVNTMADLAVHPHLRRIEVDTPNGPVSYPAPAAIVVGRAAPLWRRARRSASTPTSPNLSVRTKSS